MKLLYSETLYQLYLNSGRFTQFFYLLLFLFAVLSYRYFVKEYKWMFFLFCTFFFFEFLAGLLIEPFDLENTHFTDHFYLFFSIAIQSVLYFLIVENKRVRNLIKYLVPLLLVMIIAFALVNQGYLSGSPIAPVKYFLFSGLYLHVHRQLVINSRINRLKDNPLFWLNLGLLIMNIYYLFFVTIIDFVIPISDDWSFILYILKNAIDPVSCVLWAISIYKLRNWKQPNIKQVASQ